MKHNQQHRQSGAVSIFVVVFSSLFVTIITVSFVGLMIRGQQQAANADLSNSAYDAAQAGVEDAKRLLLKYRQCLRDSGAHSDCTTIFNLFDNPDCNMVKQGLTGDTSDDEMPIQSSSGADVTSGQLDQAYTCVTVNYTSEYKELELSDGESKLIPIESGGDSYNRVSISWFVRDQVNFQNLNLPSGASTELPTKAQWMNVGAGNTRPPILRAQWIQHSATFNSTDFDSDKTENFKSVANTKTLFLYPNSQVTSTNTFASDDRGATSPSVKGPTQVYCNASGYAAGLYACSVDLDLPDPINNTGVRTGYLQLSPYYNDTRVRISLKSTNDPVSIVAPTIDSTGRANDLFRRVKVGVSFNGAYPAAAFDITGNLCKDFSVTNTASPGSYNQGGCDPNNP